MYKKILISLTIAMCSSQLQAVDFHMQFNPLSKKDRSMSFGGEKSDKETTEDGVGVRIISFVADTKPGGRGEISQRQIKEFIDNESEKYLSEGKSMLVYYEENKDRLNLKDKYPFMENLVNEVSRPQECDIGYHLSKRIALDRNLNWNTCIPDGSEVDTYGMAAKRPCKDGDRYLRSNGCSYTGRVVNYGFRCSQYGSNWKLGYIRRDTEPNTGGWLWCIPKDTYELKCPTGYKSINGKCLK